MEFSIWNKNNRKYLALSFVFPLGGFLLLMMLGGYVPFGSYSMLFSDMYHQYFPFFNAFREALQSGESLLFHWSVGMGMDYLGLMAYYLASPLNWLSALLPESWVLPYFSLLAPIKISLASLFFSIFLKKTFGRNDFSLPLFGCFYGTCAWALGYHWNVMWLDTFALLPLVVLGATALLKDKKFFLYTIALSLSILSNYYIGLFTCIFILLVFLVYEICRWPGIGRFFADLGRMALFSTLAIAMTAVLELPAFSALQTTQSSINTFPDDFSLNIVSYEACQSAREAWTAFNIAKQAGDPSFFLWWIALGKSIPPILLGMKEVAGNLAGGLTPTFMEGLPNVYCGIGTLFLSFLFLTARQVKLRDKLCSVGLLLFLLASFVIRQLDYLWHGFHFTNMIPYRFSFLVSFVLLFMAYRAFLLLRTFRLWQILCAGGLCFLVLLFSEARNQILFWVFNGIFFLLYLGIYLYATTQKPLQKNATLQLLRKEVRNRKNRRYYASVLLLVVMGMELIVNMVNFGVQFPATNMENYPKGTTYTASMIRYMKEREAYTPFYRAEVTHSQTLNDGALNNYNGISAFTSSANVNVTRFTKALGLSAKDSYNRYCYEEGSPVSNLFLCLKYLLERDGRVEENPYFDEVHHYGDVYLLENNAYLPLGFLAEPILQDVDFSVPGSFWFQNALFSAATGLTQNVWYTHGIANLTISSADVIVEETTDSGYCNYRTDTASILRYTYLMESEGFLCLDMNMPQNNDFSVWKNNKQLYLETMNQPQMMSVCQVVPGDVIEIQIVCKAGEDSSMSVQTGILNDEVFRKGYDILNACTWELTSFTTTRIEGDISCNRDGLLYTSVPQDGNWQVWVDGELVESTTVGNAMVAVPLTEGNHTVILRYVNRSFQIGSLISALSFCAFALITFFCYRHRLTPYKGKHLS